MCNHEALRKVELDLAVEKFRKVLQATKGRTAPRFIEPKGDTMYKVRRTK